MNMCRQVELKFSTDLQVTQTRSLLISFTYFIFILNISDVIKNLKYSEEFVHYIARILGQSNFGNIFELFNSLETLDSLNRK